uniref:C2H2-type domain-containing protein n=1 Tax=Timema tahoe TaxID=61484 RepID=A0A7R9NVE1_9NEOP|nr:unnamed protein product [Timema tahoe]
MTCSCIAQAHKQLADKLAYFTTAQSADNWYRFATCGLLYYPFLLPSVYRLARPSARGCDRTHHSVVAGGSNSPLSGSRREQLTTQCDQCTASFACVARLTVHRKSVHEPRQYKCDQCLKTFQTKHHLLRHAFIHTENKPFSCPYCKYSCNTQGNITKHVKHKSLMESKSCKIKPEWIEKGEKVTEQYLKDLSAKLGQDVTLDGLRTQLLQRQKITEKESEEAKMKRLSRVQRREHSYHAKKLSSSVKNEVSISNEDSGSSSVVVELDSNIMTFPVGETDGSIYQIVPSTDNMQFIHVQAESFTQPNDVHQSFNPLVLSSELMKAHIYQMVNGDAIHLCVDGPIADPSTLQVNVKDSDDNKTLDMNRDEYLSDDVSLKDKENVDNTVVVIINTQNTSHSLLESKSLPSQGLPKSKSLPSQGLPESKSLQSQGLPESKSLQSQGLPESNSLQSQDLPKSKSLPSQGLPKSKSLPSQGLPKSKSLPSQGLPESNSLQSQGRQESKSLQSQDLPKSKSLPSQGLPESNSLPSQGLPESKSLQSQGLPESKSLPSQGLPESKSLPSQGLPKSKSLPSQGLPKSKRLPSQGLPESNSLQSQGLPESNSLQFQDLPKSKSLPSQGRQESKSLPSQGRQESNSLLSQGRQESKSLQSKGLPENKSLQSQGCQESNSLLSQGCQESNSLLSQGRQESKSLQSKGLQENKIGIIQICQIQLIYHRARKLSNAGSPACTYLSSVNSSGNCIKNKTLGWFDIVMSTRIDACRCPIVRFVIGRSFRQRKIAPVDGKCCHPVLCSHQEPGVLARLPRPRHVLLDIPSGNGKLPLLTVDAVTCLVVSDVPRCDLSWHSQGPGVVWSSCSCPEMCPRTMYAIAVALTPHVVVDS